MIIKLGVSRYLIAVLFWALSSVVGLCQEIGVYLPKKIKNSETYLFYLHGGVVTELGNNAISQAVPEWGPYEYLNILDSLQKRNFNVISEIRIKGLNNSLYVDKIASQIDTLLEAGVSEKNIVILGASAGWDIVLKVSSKLKHKQLNYVIMGGCWAETHKEYVGLDLHGHFLSIIEKSDPHGTCFKIFDQRQTLSSFKEITLQTGLSHGFIYKGYKEWIAPIVNWLKTK